MKKLIFITVGFFLLINTQYYLSPLLGFFDIFTVLILFLLFLVLNVLLVYHLIKAVKEKFTFKQRNILIICLTVTISTTLYKPLGLIDFDRLQGIDKIIAEREGAANCTTILKLKNHGIFIENTYCFGTERTKPNGISLRTIPFGLVVHEIIMNLVSLKINLKRKELSCTKTKMTSNLNH